MAGRGVHQDEGHGPNMPAPDPNTQSDNFGSGRGVHSLDDSDNTLNVPKELKPRLDKSGDAPFTVDVDRQIIFGEADPVRKRP